MGTLFNQGQGNCNYRVATYTVGYYCIFNPDATIPNITAGGNFSAAVQRFLATSMPNQGVKMSTLMGTGVTVEGAMGEFLQDLNTSKDYVFGYGFIVALLVAFAYTKMMSMNIPCMSFGLLDILVWSTVFVTGVMFFCFACYMSSILEEWKAEDPQTHDKQDLKYMKWAVSFCWLLFFAYVCFILAIQEKIRLCISLTKAAGNAIRDVNLVVLFPLVEIFGLCLFLIPWIYFTIYVNSQGCYERTNATSTGTGVNGTNEPASEDLYTWQWSSSDYYSANCAGKNGNPTSEEALYAQYYLVFCYFWTSQFIIA